MHGKHPVSGLWILFAVCAALISGCAERGTSSAMFAPEQLKHSQELARAVSIHDQGLSSWTQLAAPLDASLGYVATKAPDDIAMTQADLSVTWGEINAALRHLRELLPRLDAEPELLAREFTFVRLQKRAHFSGYYGAELLASRRRTEKFRYPLYKRPEDLHSTLLGDFSPELVGIKLVYRIGKDGKILPYHSRADIEKGVLKGQELVWVKDPIDAYFLQVQGSGKLRFEDGSTVNILYDSDNGRPYRSLGRDMTDLGLIAPGEVSMQSIRAWLDAHPDRRDAMLRNNERFVFFKLAKTSIVGTISHPLTPYVSLAVDRTVFPLGAPILFRVPMPRADASGQRLPSDKPFTGLGFAQDTGGAIKHSRIDIFCGFGKRALFEAGHLNTKGDAWLLLLAPSASGRAKGSQK